MPTPWPSWLIAAHPTRAPAAALRPFLAALSGYVRAFDAPEARERGGADVAFIEDKFGYPEEDVEVRVRRARAHSGGVRAGWARSLTRIDP